MKILAIADRPPKESIRLTLRNNQVDLICTLGDLDLFSLAELEEITNIPKIGVYGNHCSGTYFEQLGISNMHLKTFEYQGLTFGGLEGCVRYKNSPFSKMYTQEEASQLLKDYPRVDVMLTHCPPHGINDDRDDLAHQGFVGLRKYVESSKPKYLLHGHTYPETGNIIKKFAETEIIYVFEDMLIDL